MGLKRGKKAKKGTSYLKNKEARLEYQRQYYKDNKKQHLKYCLEYQKNNKELILEIARRHCKKYRYENAETIKIYRILKRLFDKDVTKQPRLR